MEDSGQDGRNIRGDETPDQLEGRSELTRRELLARGGALAVVLAAPTAFAGEAVASLRRADVGNTVNFLNGEPLFENWDPQAHTRSSQFRLQFNIFDTVANNDIPDTPQQNGVARWTQLDPTHWRIDLRKGVKWHDGSELTIDDIAASYERVSDPANKLASLSLFPFPAKVSFQIKDKYTGIMNTQKPYGGLVSGPFLELPLVKKSVIEKGDWNALPIGTGPFMVESKVGERVTLKPFPDYWGGAPKVSVTWDYVGDVNSRFAALRTGQADIISHVPPEMLAAVDATPNLTTLRYPTHETLFFTLNGRQKRFHDVRVRRAFGMAMDREAIWKDIMLKTGGTRNCLFPFGVLGYSPQNPSYIAYDPDKAKALLKQAGYPSKQAVNFIASKGFYPRSEQVVTAIDADLKKIGVNSVLNILETGKWVDSWFGLRYDANHQGWAMNVGDPDEIMAPLWRTGGNSGFSDPHLDALIKRQGVISNAAKREAFLKGTVTPYLWKAMPSIPLYGAELAYGVSKKVQGFKSGADYNPRFKRMTLSP